MRHARTNTLLTLAAVTLLSSTALAQNGAGPRRGQGRGPGWGKGPGRGPGMMAQLDLSAAQQEQIAALRSTMEEQTAQTREALDEKRSEMHALWSAETPDRDAILAKQVEMDELRRELRTAHIDFRLAVRALLTPEQRAKLDATRGRGRGGKHGWGGRGPGAGQGWGGRGPGAGQGWGGGMGPGAGPCWTDTD